MTNNNLREIILDLLLDINEKKIYSHVALGNALKKYQYFEKKDRAFITRITEGSIEYMLLLDYIIEKFSTIKIKKMKPIIKNILRMSVYQLKYMDAIPSSAICNEAVKLTEKRGFKNLKGFVNGILRNIDRNINEIEYPSEKKEPIKYLSIMYSFPEWIIKMWLKTYDYETIKQMLKSFLEEKPTTIRTSVSKNNSKELLKKLEVEHINVEKGEFLDYAFNITNYNYLDKIRAFKEGSFYVQDEASMLVCEAADIKEDMYVIDVCAAPGGKSIHIADKLMNTGKVLARDLSKTKIDLIQDNIKRSGFNNIKAECFDALVLDKSNIEKADVVIADLPCSCLGIIGRKPDIKYRVKEEDLNELSKLQKNILTVVSKYVKKGGILIYSTCTISKNENIKNINWFIKNFHFELESLEDYLPDSINIETKSKGYIQLLPSKKTDGFFIARLKKLK